MNAIIVDDDVFFCKVLEGFCEKTKINVNQVFQNPIEALDYLNEELVDLVFLDVHMPDLNGFDFLKSSPKTKVILTTLDDSKAVEAFDYDVVDFLLKPIDFNRFLRATQRVKKMLAEEKTTKTTTEKPTPTPNVAQIEHVYVNINKRLVKLMFDEINFVQAKGNYVLINRTNNENLMVHTTLKKISEKLPTNVFQQVHRSYIVNINKIVDIEDSSIVIARSVIPIGKDRRTDLLNKLYLLN
jgi:DNA-binding LytR/AlgR family response regulator